MNDKIKKTSPYAHLRRVIFLFLSIFLVTGAFFSGLLAVFYRSEVKNKYSQLEEREVFSTVIQEKSIENVFETIVADLLVLSEQNELQEYFLNTNSNNLQKLSQEYISLARHRRVYDQIRYIDESGMEVVRVNYSNGDPSRVSKDKLQLKQTRYYFSECFALHRGDIYISPFDLNVEQGRIEQPLKPMIRVGTPVFDAGGRKRGIVLLNYLGADLFAKLAASEQVSAGQTMLLNADGYWLLGPDRGLEWGFMYRDKKRSFFHRFPAVWDAIRQQQHGQILSSQGLFSFRDVFPLKGGYVSDRGRSQGGAHSHHDGACRDYHWYLVSQVPKRTLDQFAAYLMMKLFGLGAGMFCIIALGSWMVAFGVTKRRIYRAQLETMALCDALTGLPNRRLFYERLSAAIRHGKRYKDTFAVLYLDLDGFKKVNDALGHEAGDALLCEVARRLNSSIRNADTVARMGGDEFALIVDHLADEENAGLIAQKIIAELARPIALPQGEVQVGASVGISLFPSYGEDGEELLKQADRAMYRSKRQGTNLFSFYSAALASEAG